MLSRVAVLPYLILFNNYALHVLKKSLRGFVCLRFLWLFVVYIIDNLCVTGSKSRATSIWYDVMSLDRENWQCTELDPETLHIRHRIVWMQSPRGVYRYLDEWAIMQTWYRNLCLIYFSLSTEFYCLNCKSDVKLGDRQYNVPAATEAGFDYMNGEIADLMFSLNRIIYCCIQEVLEIHFGFVYRTACRVRITRVLVRISTPKWTLPNIVVTTPLCYVLMSGLFYKCL
jgi:hypothetical protein